MPYEPLQPEGLRLLRREVIAMPQSHARILVRLVFSTKNREPLILPDKRPRIFDYLGGILRGINCPVIAVGESRTMSTSFSCSGAPSR